MAIDETLASLIKKYGVKFKSKKSQGEFITDIVSLVTGASAPINNRAKQNAITTIIPGKQSTGHTILTEKMSNTNDEINKKFVASQQAASKG